MNKMLILRLALGVGLFAGSLGGNAKPAEAGWYNGTWYAPRVLGPVPYRYDGYRPYQYGPRGYYLPRAYFGPRPFYDPRPHFYRLHPYFGPPAIGFGIIVR